MGRQVAIPIDRFFIQTPQVQCHVSEKILSLALSGTLSGLYLPGKEFLRGAWRCYCARDGECANSCLFIMDRILQLGVVAGHKGKTSHVIHWHRCTIVSTMSVLLAGSGFHVRDSHKQHCYQKQQRTNGNINENDESFVPYLIYS